MTQQFTSLNAAVNTMNTPKAAPRSRQRKLNRALRQDMDYYDTDNEVLDNEDDTSIGTLSVRDRCTSPSTPVSTTELVEESNMQVDFCEMTAEEMNQILQWWSSKAWMEDVNQGSPSQNNSLLHVEDEEEEDNKPTSDIPNNSLVYDTPPQSGVDLTDLALDGDETSAKHDTREVLFADESFNLLVDQPLPQYVSFFSPIRDESVNPDAPSTPKVDISTVDGIADFSLREFSSPEELHTSVQVQHDEVTRLLFQTQDMADQVAALTETSATEDDGDHNDASTVCSSEEQQRVITPSKLPLPPRRSLRRRRRGKNLDSMTLLSSSSEDSITKAYMQLKWRDHGRLWLLRQILRLEMILVSRCLVPVFPLPLLLYLMHRPKTLRSMLCTLIPLVAVGLPFLVWWYFPRRMSTTVAPLYSLDLFLQQPYYSSTFHYSLQSPSINFARDVWVVEGDDDYGLI